MSFLYVNKTLQLNNLKTRVAVNVKTSVFVICVEGVIDLLLYNLHDSTFNGQYQVGWNAKLIKTCLFYIVFQVWRYLEKVTRHSYQFFLFVVVLHQLLHQKISLFTTFQSLTHNYLKKDFHHKFLFFNGFTQTHTPPP